VKKVSICLCFLICLLILALARSPANAEKKTKAVKGKNDWGE
jgi:hypothetical protein